MRFIVDTDKQVLIQENESPNEIPLYSKEAFEILSQQWLKVGWNEKYMYNLTWFGRPIIQLPEDMIRVQEVIYRLKPDIIVETGVAHGGSLIYYASLCKAMGHGRVIGIDIEIRLHNRKSIEEHELSSYITLIEGNSVSKEVVQSVKSQIQSGQKVLVILDSNHSKKHVLQELEAYHTLVNEGSYIVATDGLMKDLYDVPRGNFDWKWDNPCSAVDIFVSSHPEFIVEQPSWGFNESNLTENVTHWPKAWLKKCK